ncbi:MAG: hypothetical protein AB7J28_16715 [Hyphomonadaceae bacterium]
MREREEVKNHEVAKAIAGRGFSEEQAAAWFRQMVREGVFPPAGAIGTGDRKHRLYHPLTPAAAFVIRALYEFDPGDRDLLRSVFDGLTREQADGDSWIGHILACVQNYPADSDLPALVISQIFHPEEGVRRRVDILDSANPSIELADEDEVIVSLRLNLSPLLRRFVEANQGAN